MRAAGGNRVVAAASGVPKGTLNGLLSGNNDISFNRAHAIACACGVSMEWLATGTGAQAPEWLDSARAEALKAERPNDAAPAQSEDDPLLLGLPRSATDALLLSVYEMAIDATRHAAIGAFVLGFVEGARAMRPTPTSIENETAGA